MEYCRLCGHQLCEYCGLFQLFFLDGEFYTSHVPVRNRPPDYHQPPRVPRTRRRRRTPQSSHAEDGGVQGDIGSDEMNHVAQGGDEEKNLSVGEAVSGSSRGDSGVHETLLGNLVSGI